MAGTIPGDRVLTIATIMYFLIFGPINYMSLLMVNRIANAGSFELKGNIDNLATVNMYEDDTLYDLGRCGHTGYICKFHSIHGLYSVMVGAPKIIWSDASEKLTIKIDNNIVYTYDGVQERCTDNDVGYCAQNTP